MGYDHNTSCTVQPTESHNTNSTNTSEHYLPIEWVGRFVIGPQMLILNLFLLKYYM